MKQEAVVSFAGIGHEQLIDLHFLLEETRKSVAGSVLKMLLAPAFAAVDEEIARRKVGRGGTPVAIDLSIDVTTADLFGILTVWEAFVRGLGGFGPVFAPIIVALRRAITYRGVN